MKKNLQKLWMLAVLMVFGTVSSWALTADLSLNYELAGYKAKAFYDFTGNADGVLPTAGDLRFRSGYGLYNYGSGNRSGDAAIAVNESDLIVCQFADTQNRGVTINSISGCTKSTTLNDGSHIFFTADSELSTLTFGVGRGGCVVSVLIMEVDNDVATADYTLNYVYNSETVKSLTGTLAVGGTLQTDASFFVDEVKYFRADGEPGSFTIAADNNTFTVNVRLAATYNYTLTDNFGATIASGSGFEGEKATAAYPRYLLKDDKFYEADVTNKEYRKSITLDADNATATVEYTLKEGVNAVFYAEGENVSGMTATTIGNVPVRASNALAGVSTENVTITTLAPGKYKLHAGIFASKSSYEGKVVNFGIGESIFAAGFNGVNLNEVTSEEYTLNAETSVTFISEDTWVDAQFDYIWIEKTGDVDLELIAAKTALQAAITEAKAIDTTDKEGAEALAAAITDAETALAAEDATTESLTNAKNALAEAVAAFEEANKPAFDPATAIVNAGFNPEADPLGWDKVTSAQYYDLGMGLIGTYQVRGEHPAATVDETHLATEFAAGLECRWNTNYAAFTQTTAELPAGAYKLTFDVENTNATTTKANYENRFNVTVGETTYADESTEWMNGKSAWTTHTIAFTLTEASPITISLGYGTGSNNFGVGNTPALFVSHLTLEAINPIEIALIDLQAAIEAAQAKAATYTVGTEFFTYAESEIKPLNDAIATAQAAYTAAESAEAVKSATETLNAFVATFAPVMNKPAADKEYVITNKNAELALSIGNEAVKIETEGVVKFTEVEGGWVLSNNAETPEYIFKTTTAGNTWTLSTTANKDEAYVVNFNLADGAYTIQGANGLFGTDDTTEGSAVYANKTQANNGLWTVAEYVAPEPVSNDYTNYIVNADLTGEGGFDTTGTKGINGSGIVKVGSAAAFDFKQTIANLPAGQYKVTAQAAYRYGADEAAEAAAIAAETDTKLVQLYATVGEKTVSTKVQNRYDGASETDYAAGNGSVTVNEKFVPNSSDAVKAWFAAGQYVNEVIFNLPADGAVTIGINRTGTPESDYTVIGPWTLTRLGDAEVEPEPEPEPFFADGKYYIYNNGTKNYLAAGADWGTHAVVNATGLDYTLTLADGKYTMDSQISNGGNNHFLNGEWNDGAAMGWTFAAVEGKKDVYTISNGEKFLTAGENGLVTLADDATAEAAQWSVKTLEARIAELATATAEAPVNATFLIQDANFGRNDLRKSAWTMEASNQNLSGGNNTNNNAESYHSVFTLSQVLTNVPKGVYTLTAQGFYRQDGSDNENLPVFFANDYTQTFPLKTGSENSMSEASNSFSAGNYTIDPIYFQLTEAGDLTVGAKLENNTNLWCIWDNFQLTYYGVDADLEALKNAAIIKVLADLRAKAEALKAEVEVDAVKTAIDEALGATAEVSGADAINTAIVTMKAVIEKADVHIAAKAALDGMANVMAGTNVYTAEAFETYNGIYETAKGKYQAGELTKDDVIENPEVLGWHSPNNVDDLLLSVWTIGETQCKDYDAGMYINTWSVEGNNDGSNFKTPFFEYWTGDGESLGENTLTATMNNLEAGDYEVTAWVRVRAKNGYTAPAYGITFQANDGENVNAADGTQVGESQFYLKEVSATGTVAEDGVLKIKFNVAADNNISWLSFKNVKFEKKAPVIEPIEGISYSWESPAGEPIQWGGTIAYVNGDGDRLNYKNGDYWTICLNGKKANVNDEAPSANAGHMEVTLDQPLNEGDVIEITAYVNKNESKKSSAYILFDNGAEVESEAYSDEANIDPTFNGVPTTKSITVTAEMAGAQSFKMTRGQTGTNLFITKLQVIEKKGEEPKAQKYEGYVAIATTVQGAVQGTVSTEAQTVTITETAEENVVAITFSGFSATVPPTTFPEITFNANITGEEALTYTVAEGSKVAWVDGMMTRTYNVTGTGTQASAEATPVISLQLFQNPMMLTNVVFAATENEAKTALETITSISNLKANAGKESIYTLSGQKVEKAQKGLYIINGKKVVVK